MLQFKLFSESSFCVARHCRVSKQIKHTDGFVKIFNKPATRRRHPKSEAKYHLGIRRYFVLFSRFAAHTPSSLFFVNFMNAKAQLTSFRNHSKNRTKRKNYERGKSNRKRYEHFRKIHCLFPFVVPDAFFLCNARWVFLREKDAFMCTMDQIKRLMLLFACILLGITAMELKIPTAKVFIKLDTFFFQREGKKLICIFCIERWFSFNW